MANANGHVAPNMQIRTSRLRGCVGLHIFWRARVGAYTSATAHAFGLRAPKAGSSQREKSSSIRWHSLPFSVLAVPLSNLQVQVVNGLGWLVQIQSFSRSPKCSYLYVCLPILLALRFANTFENANPKRLG